jgi:hypothetical protein
MPPNTAYMDSSVNKRRKLDFLEVGGGIRKLQAYIRSAGDSETGQGVKSSLTRISSKS